MKTVIVTVMVGLGLYLLYRWFASRASSKVTAPRYPTSLGNQTMLGSNGAPTGKEKFDYLYQKGVQAGCTYYTGGIGAPICGKAAQVAVGIHNKVISNLPAGKKLVRSAESAIGSLF